MVTSKNFSFTIMVWAVFALFACGNQPHQDDIAPLTDIPARETMPSSATTIKHSEQPSTEISDGDIHQQSSSEVNGSIQEAMLRLAKTDLAERLNLSTEVIRLFSLTAVDWRDGSLDCPKDGFVYAQAITPGYLIILEHQNQKYEYHTDKQKSVILCDK
ncbi:hypothetical protein QUF64_14915 [Anaerolineales bacterium HSG6]|nr:hypothetical protein [Anaerolineales bacterium HSG6]